MENPICNTVFDTRDLQEYLEWLESEVVEEYNQTLPEENQGGISIDEIDESDIRMLDTGEEYLKVKAFCEELEKYSSDYMYGETIIHESHFTDYTEELCTDLGYISRDFPSWIEIDWEATAENVKQDYTGVTYEGETYYIR